MTELVTYEQHRMKSAYDIMDTVEGSFTFVYDAVE